MNQIKSKKNLLIIFIKRLIIVATPLLGLYYCSGLAFEENRQKEHPTDVGFGIAVLLFFILLLLFIGFIADTIYRIVKKEYKTLILNAIFILPFLFLIISLSSISSGGFLSEFIKNAGDEGLIYLLIIYLVLISLGFLIVYQVSLKKILVYLVLICSLGGGYFYNKFLIEDYYGQNKEIFFEGEINDTIMAFGSYDKLSILEEGQIESKSLNRVYIKSNNKTLELNEWIKPIAKEYSDSIKCKIYHPNN